MPMGKKSARDGRSERAPRAEVRVQRGAPRGIAPHEHEVEFFVIGMTGVGLVSRISSCPPVDWCLRDIVPPMIVSLVCVMLQLCKAERPIFCSCSVALDSR